MGLAGMMGWKLGWAMGFGFVGLLCSELLPTGMVSHFVLKFADDTAGPLCSKLQLHVSQRKMDLMHVVCTIMNLIIFEVEIEFLQEQVEFFGGSIIQFWFCKFSL